MLQPMLSRYMICLLLDFIYFVNVVEPWTEFFFSFRSPIFSSSVLVRFEWLGAPTRALQNFFVFQRQNVTIQDFKF
jgi:hypothetical protein